MAQLTVNSTLHTVLDWFKRGPTISQEEIANQDTHRDIWLNNRAPVTSSKADHYSY